MAGESERDTERAIGKLEGTIAGLKGTIEHLVNTWAEQERNATHGRVRLYEKMEQTREDVIKIGAQIEVLENLSERFGGLERKVDELEKQVLPLNDIIQRIEPIVDRLDGSSTRAQGMLFLGRAVWIIISSALGGAAGALLVRIFGKG